MFRFMIIGNCIVKSLIVCSVAYAGETINYPGYALKQAPWGTDNSLFSSNFWSDNIVNINSGSVSGHVYGGANIGAGSVMGNTVNLVGGTVVQNIYGGRSGESDGNADFNKVEIFSGAVNGIIYGGYNAKGHANNNEIIINAGAINKSIYGGWSDIDIGSANNNKVNIKDGTIKESVFGGKNAKGEAHYNAVIVAGGSITSSIYGGDSNTGNVTYNEVLITGGSVGNNIYGGRSLSGNVNYNKVVTNTTNTMIIGGSVYGGFSGTGAGSANYNTVEISGSKVTANIYGGRNTDGEVSYNGVKLLGGAEVTDAIFGGRSEGANGDVFENNVFIYDALAKDNVYGGRNLKGNAIGNKVILFDDDSVVNFSVTGGHSEENVGNANSNIVEIQAGNVKRSVYGGRNLEGNANNNIVNIFGGTIGDAANCGTHGNCSVYGGYSDIGTGTSNSNTINITAGTIMKDVFGGRNDEGDANLNEIYISLDGDIKGSVFGGWSNTGIGNANNNKIEMTGGKIGADLFGGRNEYGNSYSNQVFISGGEIANNLYGGYSNFATGAALYNRVEISGTALIKKNVYGGYNLIGKADSNIVLMSGGEVQNNLFGGFSNDGTSTANSNIVSISGGVIGDASFSFSVYGGANKEGDANLNTVNISGNADIKANIFGGWSDNGAGNANNNKLVFADNANVEGKIYAGKNDQGNANYNNIYIQDSVTLKNEVYGGYSDTGAGTASNNTININGGALTNKVYGGYNINGDSNDNIINITGGNASSDIYGGHSNTGNANNNKIEITSGATANSLYGGVSNALGNATNNIININNGAILGSTALIVGGQAGIGFDGFSGNALSISNWKGTVTGINGFEKYNFILPGEIEDNDVMVTVSGTADLTDGGTRSSNVSLSILNGGREQRVGESFVLIDAGTLITTSGLTQYTQAMKGVSKIYDIEISTISDQLIATILGKSANPSAKALGEGKTAGLAFINQGADLVIGSGFTAMLKSDVDILDPDTVRVFGIMNAGSSRYDTGSHVDIDGFSLMTGFSQKVNNNLLLATFFEAGMGSYDSYNSFSNSASISGDGNTEYYGLGILGRYDAEDIKFKGLYSEISLRGGWSSTDFSTSDLINNGEKANYDSDAIYYGAHIGIGYIFSVDENVTLDISSKYLWTHQNKDTVEVFGDEILFKSSNSHRFKNGFRLGYTDKQENWKLISYIGLAHEYEFDGKTQMMINKEGIDSPTLKGGTGIGEIGINITPNKNSAFSIELGMQGYTGVRDGFSGNLHLKYDF